MPTGNNYTIRRIRPEDIPELENLFHQVYKRPAASGYFEKKLATGYTGLEHAGFIASSIQGETVASMCMVPWFILLNGRKIKAAQLTDGMTHADYRRKGLYGQLTSCNFDLAKQSGIELIFGFPNQDALPALLKNGWEQQQQMDRFEIPVKRSILWYYNRLLRSNRSRLPEPSGEIHSVLRDGFDGIERSRDYINYKLSLGDYGIIQSSSGKAWIKARSDLSIGDMMVEDEGFNGLMKLVYKEAARNACSKIHFQCSRGTSIHHLFEKRYRAIPSFPVIIKKIHPDLNTAMIKFTYADIDIF